MIPRVDVAVRAGGWPSRSTVSALARRVRRAARAMGCTRAQLDALELRIVDDASMRVLKERHFGVAEATDVLSFPAGEPIPGQEDEGGAVDGLGEIVINRDAVARQAARPGAAGWLDEATALAIHGVAHLRGHDHDRRDRARRMLACEERGSRAVGLPCARPYGGRTPVRPRIVVAGRAALGGGEAHEGEDEAVDGLGEREDGLEAGDAFDEDDARDVIDDWDDDDDDDENDRDGDSDADDDDLDAEAIDHDEPDDDRENDRDRDGSDDDADESDDDVDDADAIVHDESDDDADPDGDPHR